MNEREVFAYVLLNLVRGQCAVKGSDSVSRTGLQAQVPVNERAYARRGLTALIEHNALLMRGEQIGLTPRGRLYLAEHVIETAERPMLDAVQDADLLSLRSAIRQDARLSHDSMEAAQTLPGRLQEPEIGLPVRQHHPLWRIALVIAVVALVVYGLSRVVGHTPAQQADSGGPAGGPTRFHMVQSMNGFQSSQTARQHREPASAYGSTARL